MPSSGQGGPCCHCGRTSSCCWRRGPASKPVLCNACGSRYLVKRSLEGYQPLQTRRETAAKAQAEVGVKPSSPARRVAPAAGRVAKKPKRVVQKRVDSDAWNSGAEDSEGSEGTPYLTDDSAGGSRRAAGRRGAAAEAQHAQQLQREPSGRASAAASKLKLSYITSQSQLKDFDSADLSSIAGAFFASSLRLKPRKPVVVTVSAVW
ncbi:GATA transcription factor 26-like [Micractinium conductrix]|uniref:GATA transcription factor 26-like n=1 Tax=Micractinium conductrix TaxID=554055 RepID=A0A2P6VDW6_9CHLO|nr:GATA transcription factor 26-like [Micractinium conductrix]|eukprot:PSC72272.1 GATA transcription factor 26-like [Micractinium conductrix]